MHYSLDAVISEIRTAKSEGTNLWHADTAEHAAKTSVKIYAALGTSTALLTGCHRLQQRFDATNQRNRG